MLCDMLRKLGFRSKRRGRVRGRDGCLEKRSKSPVYEVKVGEYLDSKGRSMSVGERRVHGNPEVVISMNPASTLLDADAALD